MSDAHDPKDVHGAGHSHAEVDRHALTAVLFLPLLLLPTLTVLDRVRLR